MADQTIGVRRNSDALIASRGAVRLSDSKVTRIRLSLSKSLIVRYNDSDLNRMVRIPLDKILHAIKRIR